MQKSDNQYDVIIVGGGMVGAALALMLGRQNLQVALLDATPSFPQWHAAEYDIRVSAVTRASENILRYIGVWSAIAGKRVSPYREMFVWDATGGGHIHFDSADLGEASLGHIIENSAIQASLWEQLCELDHVTLRFPVQLESLQRLPDGMELIIADGNRLSAPLIVGADGSRSWVREQAGIGTHRRDYHQSAVVATVSTELSHQMTAWQRFLPTGPLAFLPMAGQYCSIVWSCPPAQAQSLAQMPESEFNSAITQAFEGRLGQVTVHGKRGVFPLQIMHAREYVRDRIALVGDAAHTIHPLAGQGVNLGFADAASLAELVLEAKRNKYDIGNYRVLRKYERWRKGQNLLTLAAMDGFKHLFSNDVLALSFTRNLGLNMADRLPFFKNLAAQHAMGLKGDLPTMAQTSDSNRSGVQ